MENLNKVNIRVDAGKVRGDLKHVWRYIGYDECNYTQTPEGTALLRQFGNLEDGPYFVRTHHLFCTGNCQGVPKWGSTNVYTEDDQGNPRYTWEVIDEIIDILLANNCKPFIELGFMPMDLVKPELFAGKNAWERFGYYKSELWAYPPKDYDKWYDLIYSFVRHCVMRYSQNEVLQWYWELWNEPDIFYWKGTLEEFCKLYDYTEAAIHSALPEARLGGPATTGPTSGSNSQIFLDKFLEHCKSGTNYFSKQTGTRLDFVSFHVKGGGFPFQLNAPKSTPSTKSFAEQVKVGLEIIRKHGYERLEVVLSEADPDGWAAGGRYDNQNLNFRNTEYYAGFVAASYHIINQLAFFMGMDVRPLAWAFLFPGERCFEGTRTFTTQGIHKAVFNLFRMYAKMGDRELEFQSCGEIPLFPYRDDFGTGEAPQISRMASASREGKIQILVFNHHDDWDLKGEYEVELTVENCGLGPKVQLKHYRIDQSHSNAYAEWVREGKPKFPEWKQYERIKLRDSLELFQPVQEKEAIGGKVNIDFTIPVHGISLIIIDGVRESVNKKTLR